MEPAFGAESEPREEELDHVVVLHAVPWSVYEALVDVPASSAPFRSGSAKQSAAARAFRAALRA